RHIVAKVFDPLREPHFTISLSAKVGARAFQVPKVTQTTDGQIASAFRVHAAGNELARPHLDVEGDFLVDFLFDRHTPEPRAKGLLHRASRIFETPIEKRRHISVSAASCSRPVSVRRYNLARRPSSDVPHSASTHRRRSIR